jgi:hypothetical protein
MGEETARLKDATLLARFATLGAVRDEVNLALEQKRQEKEIKASLSAQVRLEPAVTRRDCWRSTATSCPPCSGCRTWKWPSRRHQGPSRGASPSHARTG